MSTRNDRSSSGSSSSTLPDRYSRISLDRAGSEATARRRSLVCLPWVARWNSCNPAAQPSSPRASWATSPGGSGSPYTSANSRSTSHERNRRSWAISRSAPDTQPRQVPARGLAARRGQHQPRRGELDQLAQRGLGRRARQLVQVVEGEDHPLGRHPLQRVGGLGAGAPPRPGVPVEAGDHGGQRLAHVAQQGGLPPVAGVDPVPGRGGGQRRGVLGQQGGLAAARRPGDEHEAVVGGAAERPQQALAGQGPTGGGRMRARGTASSGTSRSAS